MNSLSDMLMFTIFHFFTVFSRLKSEVETNFDLTDNMMTGTESMCLGHVLKIVEAEQHLVWKNPFTRNGIYMVTFQTTLKF